MRFSLILTLLFAPFALFATPSGLEVTCGSASVARTPEGLVVSVGERSVLSWRDFYVGPNETIRIVQPSSSSLAVIRVVGGVASNIFGTIESNGRLAILNGAGILVGPSAKVCAASIVGMALDTPLADMSFATELSLHAKRGAGVINFGSIEAFDGDLFLLGEMVHTHGTLSAKSVRIGAGRDILVLPSGRQRLIIQPRQRESHGDTVAIYSQGLIQAHQIELRADPNSYALSIHHSGEIRALESKEGGGQVDLIAENGRIALSGQLIASNLTGIGGSVHLHGDEIFLQNDALINVSGLWGGGEVLIGCDRERSIEIASYLMAEEGVRIYADCLDSGNGGKVVMRGRDVCGLFGKVSVAGGPRCGLQGGIDICEDAHIQ